MQKACQPEEITLPLKSNLSK